MVDKWLQQHQSSWSRPSVKPPHKGGSFLLAGAFFGFRPPKRVMEVRRASMLEAVQGMESGDMIFFDGGTGIIPDTIKRACCCPYSHAALVVRRPSDGRLGIWEATLGAGGGQKDMITGGPLKGVRVVELIDRLAMEPNFAVSHLHIEDPTMRDEITERIWQFVLDNNGKDYEHDLFHLIWAWFDSPANLISFMGCGCCFGPINKGRIATACGLNNRSTESFFCSELVAETLMDTGIIIPRPVEQPNPWNLKVEPSAEFTTGKLYDVAWMNDILCAPGFWYGEVLPWDVSVDHQRQ